MSYLTRNAGNAVKALMDGKSEIDTADLIPGNGFELIGLLAIFDPPRDGTKQNIDDAIALGIKVKMVTSDQLAIAKETRRCLGLGEHIYLAKVLKDGPPSGEHMSPDERIMDANGFATLNKIFSATFPRGNVRYIENCEQLSIAEL